MFGKPKFRKNLNVHPCFTEFSKTQEAMILKKKEKDSNSDLHSRCTFNER